jgi:hypothetical protein
MEKIPKFVKIVMRIKLKSFSWVAEEHIGVINAKNNEEKY